MYPANSEAQDFKLTPFSFEVESDGQTDGENGPPAPKIRGGETYFGLSSGRLGPLWRLV